MFFSFALNVTIKTLRHRSRTRSALLSGWYPISELAPHVHFKTMIYDQGKAEYYFFFSSVSCAAFGNGFDLLLKLDLKTDILFLLGQEKHVYELQKGNTSESQF